MEVREDMLQDITGQIEEQMDALAEQMATYMKEEHTDEVRDVAGQVAAEEIGDIDDVDEQTTYEVVVKITASPEEIATAIITKATSVDDIANIVEDIEPFVYYNDMSEMHINITGYHLSDAYIGYMAEDVEENLGETITELESEHEYFIEQAKEQAKEEGLPEAAIEDISYHIRGYQLTTPLDAIVTEVMQKYNDAQGQGMFGDGSITYEVYHLAAQRGYIIPEIEILNDPEDYMEEE